MTQQDLFKTLGREAQSWRKCRGLSQGDIAFRLNMTHANISAFERGKNDNCAILLMYMAMGFYPLESEEIWQILTSL